MHRMLKIEWNAVAGVLAAVIAIVLHLLGYRPDSCRNTR